LGTWEKNKTGFGGCYQEAERGCGEGMGREDAERGCGERMRREDADGRRGGVGRRAVVLKVGGCVEGGR
jgi:hypothetical protein